MGLGFISILVSCLDENVNQETTASLLESLTYLFEFGIDTKESVNMGYNKYVVDFVEVNGGSVLEKLQET